MKMFYYLGAVSFLFFANPTLSHFSYHNTHLEAQIKPNPTNGSKPAKTYLKFASVSFLPQYSDKIILFSCSEGYDLVDGSCKAAACEGYSYTAAELVNCKEYESCKSGEEYKYRCKTCQEGLENNDGACECNREAYPFNPETAPCSYAYDDSNVCQEYDSAGKIKKYYAGCLCPDSWSRCDGEHEVGLGAACESYDKKSYYSCGCEESYNKTCLDSRPVNVNDYCLNLSDATRYYNECYYCEINKGEVYSLDEYWCDHEWIEFPVIEDLFAD